MGNSRFDDILPKRWEMFTEEGERLVTKAVYHWTVWLEEEDPGPTKVIPALDEFIKQFVVERGHKEVTDTEPREHLSTFVKNTLDWMGYASNLTQHSQYAASIWD